jgi:hypothetical protein
MRDDYSPKAGAASLVHGSRMMAAALCLALAAAGAGCASSPGKSDAVSGPSPAAAGVAPITGAVEPVAGAGRTLVVYFSQGSSTKRVAEDIAALTGADIEILVEKKTRSGGFFGFMKAGMDATFGTATPILEPELSPDGYDAVFVLTPVWSWNLCPPVRSWLRANKGSIAKAAFVTVSGDTEPDKIAGAMAKEGGVEPFAVAGFAERDFYPENYEAYAARIAGLLAPLR